MSEINNEKVYEFVGIRSTSNFVQNRLKNGFIVKKWIIAYL